MTKKQYNTWKVSVGTVKKSNSNHLPVIGEEGQPTLAWITAAPHTLQIPGYGSFGNDEAQLLEFSMDPGRPPGRILFGQVSDERLNFGSSFRSAGACSRLPLPEEPKSSPVPANDGLRFTATRTSAHRDQMQCRVIQNSRSKGFNRGRLGEANFRVARDTTSESFLQSRDLSSRPMNGLGAGHRSLVQGIDS